MVSIVRRRGRSRAIGGVTVAGFVLAAVFSPVAFADPVTTVHDFSTGAQGWFTYNNTGTSIISSTATGEFCASVGADTGNPWDHALQHDSVTYDRNVTYTVTFDAHASRAVNVPMQGGAGYPDAFGHSVALDGSATPQHVAFTFTPSTWPTGAGDPLAADWTTTTGNVSFQLGAQGTAFDLCIDNFSITSDTTIVQHSFAAGDVTGGWDLYDKAGGGTPYASTDGSETCINLAGTYSNPYDAGLTLEGVPVIKDANYVLSFTAHVVGLDSVTVNAKVGEKNGGWRDAFAGHPVLTPTVTPYSFAFTSPYDIPAVPATDGGVLGRIDFELATVNTPYTFCISELSLVKTAAAPPVYAPDTGPRVRVNQVGYLPNGPKQATLVTDVTTALPWQLKDAANATVAEGTSTPEGIDASAALNVQGIDFSTYTTAGTGYTLVADGETSRPFDIDAALYQKLRSDALDYFYLVRSGIAIDNAIEPGYARAAGHVSTAGGTDVNQGDLAVPCLTQAEETATGKDWAYGDWTCPDGFTQDVVGGWYDAGDQGKYVVNGGITAAQLMSTYERTLYAPTADAAALGDSTLAIPETGDGVPDVLNEARWELEFLLSMQVPADQTLGGMAFHKIQDVTWTGVPLDPAADPKARRLHRPSTAATLNLAAAAAQGARLFAQFDPTFAAKLLAASQAAWDAAVAHPDLFAPPDTATTGNNGGGAYVDSNVSDEFYWAAAELYITTGEAKYEQAVVASPGNDVSTDATVAFGPSGFNWGGTTALGRLDLATVPNALPGRTAIVQSVIAAADRYVATQAAQPFGTTYAPTDGVYEWGSNSMVLNNDVVMATAFDLTGQDKYRNSVLSSMDYLLGRNALNQSYVTGWGEVSTLHQHNRWFLLSESGNSPTGALAGGPNSTSSTWDPTMAGTFTKGCSPQMCYLDNVQAWSVNEVAINWNSALSWVASFVADQKDGAVDPDGAVVTIATHPVDVTVNLGTTATFTAAATGEPVPSVQWQVLQAGTWTDLAGAESTTLSVAATLARHGSQYRAVFTNDYGWVVTDSATLRIAGLTDEGPKVVLSRSSLRAGESLTITVTGMAAGETVEVWLMNSDPVRLVSRTTVDGTLSLTATVPASTTPGAHTIRALGLSTGLEATAPLTVLAAPTADPGSVADPGPLANTGADLGWLGIAALLMLALGLGVLAAARFSRTREA